MNFADYTQLKAWESKQAASLHPATYASKIYSYLTPKSRMGRGRRTWGRAMDLGWALHKVLNEAAWGELERSEEDESRGGYVIASHARFGDFVVIDLGCFVVLVDLTDASIISGWYVVSARFYRVDPETEASRMDRERQIDARTFKPKGSGEAPRDFAGAWVGNLGD